MVRSVLIVPAVLAAAAGAAWADADRPRAAAAEPKLTAEPAAVSPGTTLVLRGRGFPRNAQIVLRAGSRRGEAVRIGSARTSRRGAFTAPIAIRARSTPGRFTAIACYDHCAVKASAGFRIVAR